MYITIPCQCSIRVFDYTGIFVNVRLLAAGWIYYLRSLGLST